MKNLTAKILWSLATGGAFVAQLIVFAMYEAFSYFSLWWITVSWVLVIGSLVLMWLGKVNQAVGVYFWSIIVNNVATSLIWGVSSDDDIILLIVTVFLVLLCIVPALTLTFSKKVKKIGTSMAMLIACIIFSVVVSLVGAGSFVVTPMLAGLWRYLFPVIAVVTIGVLNRSIKKSLQTTSVAENSNN